MQVFPLYCFFKGVRGPSPRTFLKPRSRRSHPRPFFNAIKVLKLTSNSKLPEFSAFVDVSEKSHHLFYAFKIMSLNTSPSKCLWQIGRKILVPVYYNPIRLSIAFLIKCMAKGGLKCLIIRRVQVGISNGKKKKKKKKKIGIVFCRRDVEAVFIKEKKRCYQQTMSSLYYNIKLN